MFTKQQRNGIFLLVLLIMVMQLGCFFIVPITIGNSIEEVSYTHEDFKRFSQEVDSLRQVELASRQNDSLQLGYGYNNFGRLFFDQGDLVRAYENLISAKDIFDSGSENFL